MLIDLFIHEGEGRPLSTSDLCVTSTIPMSSALRLVQKPCDARLVDRTPDLMDARGNFVRLQPATSLRMRAYSSEAPQEYARDSGLVFTTGMPKILSQQQIEEAVCRERMGQSG